MTLIYESYDAIDCKTHMDLRGITNVGKNVVF